eukprot:15606267-Heterocapsa_arctica.AAC.1
METVTLPRRRRLSYSMLYSNVCDKASSHRVACLGLIRFPSAYFFGLLRTPGVQRQRLGRSQRLSATSYPQHQPTRP